MSADEPILPVPLAELEHILDAAPDGRYVLRLYVAGNARLSTRAVENIRKTCEAHLPGRYELIVIDLYQQPGEAAEQAILAAPTLIKELPLPLRRLMGDLTDTNRVLLALDLKPEDP